MRKARCIRRSSSDIVLPMSSSLSTALPQLVCIALPPVMLVPAAHAEPWRTAGSIHGQLTGMDGHVVGNGRRIDVDVNLDESDDDTDVAGTMAVRSEKEHHALGIDVTFIGVDDRISAAGGVTHDLDFTQDMVELTWSWRFDPRYEVFAGGRYQSLSVAVATATKDGERDESVDVDSLLDPVLGVRATWSLGSAWRLIARADIAGLGLGTDFSWGALGVIDWSIGARLGLVLGYRTIATEYDKGSGSERFELDVRISGPLLGVRYDFEA